MFLCRYVETSAQTFNPDKKAKDQQTNMVHSCEMGTQANDYDLYDVMVAGQQSEVREDGVELEPVGAAGGGKAGGSTGGVAASGDDFSSAASASGVDTSMMSGSSVSGGIAGMVDDSAPAAAQPKEVSLKSLTMLPTVLRIAERMVSQNIYQAKHLQYRCISQAVDSRLRVLPSLPHCVHGVYLAYLMYAQIACNCPRFQIPRLSLHRHIAQVGIGATNGIEALDEGDQRAARQGAISLLWCAHALAASIYCQKRADHALPQEAHPMHRPCTSAGPSHLSLRVVVMCRALNGILATRTCLRQAMASLTLRNRPIRDCSCFGRSRILTRQTKLSVRHRESLLFPSRGSIPICSLRVCTTVLCASLTFARWMLTTG